MWSFSTGALALIGLTFALAGVVKGVAGMGLPTVSMGVLGTFMSPLSATSLLLIPSFVTNVWQLVTGPDFRALVGRLWTMMAGIFIGTLVGVRLITGANTRWTTIGLGVALASYALYSLLARPLSVPKRVETRLSPVIGLLTGLISGATGVFTIPAVPYLQGLNLEKDDLIQALGLSFTVSTIALAIGLVSNGAFHLGNLALSALAIVPGPDRHVARHDHSREDQRQDVPLQLPMLSRRRRGRTRRPLAALGLRRLGKPSPAMAERLLLCEDT